MPPAEAVQKLEPGVELGVEPDKRVSPITSAPRVTNPTAVSVDQIKLPLRPVVVPSKSAPRQNSFHFQARAPVIAGEATYHGALPIDGVISGQLGANGGTLSVRQRPRGGPFKYEPELNGEICFKDMLRVNGYIAGKVSSQKGTLIVANEARVDADIEVGVAIIGGIVNGDVVGHERVELGAEAKVNGNISTRSLSMKPGAVLQGDCRVLKGENDGT